jgi:hypothetical protein
MATFAAAPLAGLSSYASANTIVDLQWSDLIPEGTSGVLWQSMRRLSGVVQHGELTTGFDQEEARALTNEFDGKLVRIPGFIVPLDFDSSGVTTFILAPFVGACIHVPPPPANQLILVTTEEPYDYQGLFDAVYVTGLFGAAASATLLAEIGYAISAEDIEPYS